MTTFVTMASCLAVALCVAWPVAAQPVSLKIQQQNKSQVLVSWPAGLELVQPQKTTNLASGAWQDLGAATAATNMTEATGSGRAFYRLRFLAPSILAQPQAQSVAVGGNATFKVTASGTAPLVFQWRKNGSDLVSQTAASLELTRVALSNAGDYIILITNRAGAVTSVVAALTVKSAVISPRGIYMGSFVGQTNGGFASVVTSNQLAMVLGHSPAQNQSVLVTNLAVGSDGSFSARLAQGASIRGTFTPDAISGTLVGTNGVSGAFNGARKVDTGIQQSNAGFYAGSFGGLLSGDVSFILAADGTTFAHLSSAIVSGGTFGRVDAANTLSATVPYTFPGAMVPSLIQISGALNPGTHQITGAYTFGGITLGTFLLARVSTP